MTTLKSTKLNLEMKKGKLISKEVNKYETAAKDVVTEQYNSDCELDSDNLSVWLSNVVESWTNGASIRDDAKLKEDNIN